MLRLASAGVAFVLFIALSCGAHSEIAPTVPQTQDGLSRCWQDLASEDAGTAYRAAWQLAQNPAPALTLFRKHLKPAAGPDPKQLQSWVTLLESPRFAVRDKAFKDLEMQGELAEAVLRKALAKAPELETRRRFELLLERLQTTVTSPEKVRLIRAAAVLEILGTVGAKELLAELANGFPQHRLTREAQESLKRLEQRSAVPDRWLARTQSALPAGKEDALPFGARIRLGTRLFRHEGYGKAVQFSPDSRLAISSDEGSVYVWETGTGKLERKFEIVAECLAVAPKGTLLALGVRGSMQGNGAVVWWDWQAGKEVGRVPLPPNFTPRQVGFSHDGKRVICRDDQGLRIWESDSRTETKAWNTVARQPLYGFSADGNHVAVGSAGSELHVLDLQTMAKVVVQGAQRQPYWVAFSPDGKFLTMRDDDDGGGRIWDVATGKVLWRLPEGGRSPAFSGCFSADGKLLAAGSSEGVGVWELKTGKLLKRLPGINRVDAISPDGRWLATAGYTLRVCSVETGKAVETGEGHFSAIERLAFLPQFDLIATAQNSGAVRLWDAVTGAPKGFINTDINWIRWMSFSPDGRYVAAGRPGPRDGFIGVWEKDSGRQFYKLPGHAVRDFGRFTVLGFSPDNRYLLSWGDDFYLRKWDLKTGKALLENRTIPTGQKVADADEDGRIGGGRKEEELFGLANEDAAFTPQGDQFLLLSVGGRLHCFDVASGKESRVLQIGEPSQLGASLSVSPTGTQVVTMSRSRSTGRLQLVVCDLTSGLVLFNLSIPGRFGEARFAPDGRTVAAAGGDKVVLVEVATGKIRLEVDARSRHVAFSPDGRYLVSAMPDTTALVWDLAALTSGSKLP